MTAADMSDTEQTPYAGRARFIEQREGPSERAQQYRRLMGLVQEQYPVLDWLQRDTAVNLYLDNPDRTVEELIASTPADYFFTPEDNKEEKPTETSDRDGDTETSGCDGCLQA